VLRGHERAPVGEPREAPRVPQPSATVTARQPCGLRRRSRRFGLGAQPDTDERDDRCCHRSGSGRRSPVRHRVVLISLRCRRHAGTAGASRASKRRAEPLIQLGCPDRGGGNRGRRGSEGRVPASTCARGGAASRRGSRRSRGARSLPHPPGPRLGDIQRPQELHDEIVPCARLARDSRAVVGQEDGAIRLRRHVAVALEPRDVRMTVACDTPNHRARSTARASPTLSVSAAMAST
jgi:hypothetical protein